MKSFIKGIMESYESIETLVSVILPSIIPVWLAFITEGKRENATIRQSTWDWNESINIHLNILWWLFIP